MGNISNAILDEAELKEHLDDKSNHYLYKKNDDGTITVWMCCDFEIVKPKQDVIRGGCGDGICYDPTDKSISIERR